jgi:mediator of RNA polymerase II transcription subunit 5
MEPTIALKVLYALVKPSSISGEAEAFHRTVVNISARTLEEQLKDVRVRHPGRSDIKPIVDVLEPYVSFQRNGSSRRSELDGWTSHAGGLTGAIRNTFHALVVWSANSEMSMSPPSYTHRQILAGVRILGSPRVLTILIDELKAQVEAGSLDLALDIAATLVSAPMPESFAVEQTLCQPINTGKEALSHCPILTLRDALLLQHANVPKVSEKDPLHAEIIVRLTRRVNALLTPSSSHVASHLDVTNIIENINLEAAAAAAASAQDPMDLGSTTAGDTTGMGDPTNENIDQILNDAAGGQAGDLGLGLDGDGAAMDTSIEDMLNAANMGNPEFLTDLDMDGMF